MLVGNKHVGGLTGGYQHILSMKDAWKSPHILNNRPVRSNCDRVIPLSERKRSQDLKVAVLGLRDLS